MALKELIGMPDDPTGDGSQPAGQWNNSGTQSGMGTVAALVGNAVPSEYTGLDKFDNQDYPSTNGFYTDDENIFEFMGDYHFGDSENFKRAPGLPILNPTERAKFSDYRKRIIRNRNTFTSFDGDLTVDFAGFDEHEIHEYCEFLGLENIGKAIGNAVKSVGSAIGSAGKFVGNTVAKGAVAVAHGVRGAAQGIGNAAAWTGGRALQAGKWVGTGVVNAGKYTVRNAGNILETGAGIALAMATDGALGANFVADGMHNMITDANGGEDVIAELLSGQKMGSGMAAATPPVTNIGGGLYGGGLYGSDFDAPYTDSGLDPINEDDEGSGELNPDYDSSNGNQQAAQQAAIQAAQIAKAKQALNRARVKKYIIIAVIAAVVCLGGYYGYQYYKKHHKK